MGSVNTQRPFALFSLETADPAFKLSEDFLNQYRHKEPNWGPIGYVVYKRTYARALPDGSTEEWWQTVQRVVEGTYRIQQLHCAYNHVIWDQEKAQRSAQEMYERIFSFKFLPPGRGLWMMGTEFIKTRGGAALNNCAFTSTENIGEGWSEFVAPFAFLMDMSMLGVGVGGDCRGAGHARIVDPMSGAGNTIEISDAREGWVYALKCLLRSYVDEDYQRPRFDYRHIRPAGEPIRGFGGVASGAEPLRKLLEESIPAVLDRCVGSYIDSTAIVDIFNVIGVCVVAGNVRRTAEIMFSDADDHEFMALKDPTVSEAHQKAMISHRWASNNSIFPNIGMDYRPVAERIVAAGEPGLAWLDNMQRYSRMIDGPDEKDWRAMGGNPCLEQTLESFELCCLVETFPAHHATLEDYFETCKYAYLYAKTVTLLPTHDPRTNAVMARNRRIGMSQSGIVQSFGRHGRRTHFLWCDKAYRFTRKLDEKYSNWLAVPRSIKMTSVKPSGTVSKLAGASPGIHYPISEYYIRRVTFAKNHPLVDVLAAHGYPVEDSVYSTDSVVVSFPVKEPYFVQGESDVTLWEQLENAAQMQAYWADNQVSCTVKFHGGPEAVNEIASALSLYETRLKGISFLPHAHGYAQAPEEPISKEQYEELAARTRPLTAAVVNFLTHDTDDKFCDGDACELPSK